MNKNGGKEDESTHTESKMILLQYAKENRFPNPTFFVDDGYSGTGYDRPGFRHACGIEVDGWLVSPKICPDWVEILP